MLLEAVSFAILGMVAYRAYGGSLSTAGITQTLNSRIDNGYQLRDITYTDKIDIASPDVKNNVFAMTSTFGNDRGINGVPRVYAQQYAGSSEVAHLYRTDNLIL